MAQAIAIKVRTCFSSVDRELTWMPRELHRRAVRSAQAIRSLDSMSVVVRSAAKNDIPVLVELMREFYAESKYKLDGDWAVRSFNELLQSPDRGAAWIGFRGSDPTGYVVLTTRHSMESGGLDGFVDDLFVRPAFRRHAVGTALLTEVFRECSKRGVLAVHIEVGSDNAAVQALCRRFGLSNNGRQVFTARVAD